MCYRNARDILRLAFDQGITRFDLANNYGPPAGSAEEKFGKIFNDDFKPYRDELIISSKAGWVCGQIKKVGSQNHFISAA
ncbi:MAG: aldo/keto reductase [Chryseolinea sp.]